MAIRIRDRNNIPELIQNLNELKSKKVKIGIFGDDDSHILMIANVHEFGASIKVTQKMRGWFLYQGFPLSQNTTQINIPERSFMRSGYDKNEKKLIKICEKGLKSIIKKKMNTDQVLNLIGMWLVSRIQDNLVTLKSPANSSMTIQQKGSSNPLIDTGRLIQSITYKVE